jgi:short-subunit dehydrogenase
MAGLQGSPGVAHYAASKAYSLVLAEGLWGELEGKGVDVLACAAGPTRTPGYEANPAPNRLLSPPVMEAADVVEEALGALGRRPSLIPGFWNKLAALFLRLLSRKRAVRLIQKSTESLGPQNALRSRPG